jgi:hypothetical protein
MPPQSDFRTAAQTRNIPNLISAANYTKMLTTVHILFVDVLLKYRLLHLKGRGAMTSLELQSVQGSSWIVFLIKHGNNCIETLQTNSSVKTDR